MAKDHQTPQTIWTSTFEERKGIPEVLSGENIPAEELRAFLEAQLDQKRAEPYESRLDERLFAATFG